MRWALRPQKGPTLHPAGTGGAGRGGRRVLWIKPSESGGQHPDARTAWGRGGDGPLFVQTLSVFFLNYEGGDAAGQRQTADKPHSLPTTPSPGDGASRCRQLLAFFQNAPRRAVRGEGRCCQCLPSARVSAGCCAGVPGGPQPGERLQDKGKGLWPGADLPPRPPRRRHGHCPPRPALANTGARCSQSPEGPHWA